MRRRCYERIGGWDIRYRYSPDFEWWLRAGDAKFVGVPEPVGAWRVHAGSITMNNFDVDDVRTRLRERFLMLDEIFAREDLAPAVRDVKAEAYGTTLIELGSLLVDQSSAYAGPRRFSVDDTLMPFRSEFVEEAHAELQLANTRLRRLAEQRYELAATENAQLSASVEVLRLQTREQDALIELLTRGQRSSGRPLWLKIARRLVPQRLRPRIGAAFHKLRHRRAA
jgi:hypothetical protein